MSTRGSSAWRNEHYGRHCQSAMVKIRFGPMDLNVNTHAVSAFEILAEILIKHGYQIDKKQTGSYNCRPIKGSSAWSSHAWALGVDVNWNQNPYGKKLITDIPIAAIREILALKTKSGHRVFKWGGDWDNRPETDHNYYDAMHFEIIATPGELKLGIDYDSTGYDVVAKGEKSGNVTYWQNFLKARGHYSGAIDGDFGPATENAVKSAQSKGGLPVTGVIDVTTGALLTQGASLSKQGGSAKLPQRAEAIITFKEG